MSTTLFHTVRAANGSWPSAFTPVPVAANFNIPAVACATNAGGDLHVTTLDTTNQPSYTVTLRHTALSSNGTWPFPLKDVQSVVPGPTIGITDATACAANASGDLHLCARQEGTGRLFHTERQVSGAWPFPFGDVQAVINQGSIGPVGYIACATNPTGDLHLLALDQHSALFHTLRMANGTWPFKFGNVQAAINQGNIGPIETAACATNHAGDLHICVVANHKLWHTIRLANGSWPFPFADVRLVINQGASPQFSKVACATDPAGDLHMCALDETGTLWHTMRMANGTWPFPYGNVQTAINQGNIGFIHDVACAANQSGQLHILATTGFWPLT